MMNLVDELAAGPSVISKKGTEALATPKDILTPFTPELLKLDEQD